jgi:two-component system, sensor histidine kinase
MPKIERAKSMTRWGIKKRVLFLALAPALLTALVLVSYFVLVRFAGVENEQRAHALSLARQFALRAAPAVQATDRAQLEQHARMLLLEQDVCRVTLTDNRGATLVQLSNGAITTNQTSAPVVVEWPIENVALAPSGTPATLDGNSSTASARSALGKVSVEVSQRAALQRLWRELGFLIALWLVCLSAAAALALRLGREITLPIGRLAKAVDGLAAGDLDTRIPVDSGGEFAKLESGINDMAVRLKASQENLQRRVTDATANLLAQKDEAERANMAKSRFLAAASHDLRQPMHALMLFVTDLKQRIQYPEVSRIVHNIETSVNAMVSLFNALLDISRLDAGVLHANPVDFPIKSLFDRLRVEFSASAREKDLDFSVMGSKLVVRTDPLLLERIVVNLVSNAVRYTARGGIVVGCRRQRDSVRIEVWDSGPGVPLERQRDIFQEFFQLSNPERDRSKGLGLGLAIVERMAKLIGTRVRLRSVLGKGSVFYLTVPLGSAARVARERSEVTEALGQALAGVFVIVIDDEGPILEGMRGLLAGWQCEVAAVESQALALAAVQQAGKAPDVIISDYRLRDEENGIDVIRALRARFGNAIPGILVTGDTAPDRLREAEQSGFHLIHKPVRPAKLRTLLTHLVNREKARANVA